MIAAWVIFGLIAILALLLTLDRLFPLPTTRPHRKDTTDANTDHA